MSLDEETVKKAEEKRDHDEQHQRGEIAEDKNEHEPSFDATGRIDALCAFRGAQPIAVIAEDDERAATEVPCSFQIVRDGSECRHSDSRRLTCERGKEWRSQRVLG